MLELIEFLVHDGKANKKHQSKFSEIIWTFDDSCEKLHWVRNWPKVKSGHFSSLNVFLDFSELEYKILIKCLDCLFEIKLPHNKIRSILVLLETFHFEIAEMQETSKKLVVKYAAVLKLIENGEFPQNEQIDFVLLRISTVTVTSVQTTKTIITTTTEESAVTAWASLQIKRSNCILFVSWSIRGSLSEIENIFELNINVKHTPEMNRHDFGFFLLEARSEIRKTWI